jgi:hypothetical protein
VSGTRCDATESRAPQALIVPPNKHNHGMKADRWQLTGFLFLRSPILLETLRTYVTV